jgi:putative oxidoreductase
MSKIVAFIGRLLIGLLFVWAGAGKLLDIGATETQIVATGLPSGLAIPVAAFEIIAGLCLALGFMVRLTALLLAIFTAATILFFHNQFNEPAQAVQVTKNLAIIGGLFCAFAYSQMWHGYDAIQRERRGEKLALDAERRAREAELRAARAEGRAEAGGTVTTVADTDGDGIADTRMRKRRWFDW